MRRILLALLAVLLFAGCGTAAEDAPQVTESSIAPESTTSSSATTQPPMDSTTTTSETLAVAAPANPVQVPAPVDVTVRSITVGGMGSQYSEPDRCIVDLGSSSRRPTVEAANQAASASAQAMTDALTTAGVDPANIQTSEFSINPYYDDWPAISGYEAHHGFRVTMPDVDAVGAVLANAIAAGGDEVRAWGIRFEADPADLIGPAREAAWADALSRAQALAELAGESLGDLLDAHEKVLLSTSQGMMEGGEGDAASFNVPVSPGVSGVVVLLTATFAIGE